MQVSHLPNPIIQQQLQIYDRQHQFMYYSTSSSGCQYSHQSLYQEQQMRIQTDNIQMNNNIQYSYAIKQQQQWQLGTPHDYAQPKPQQPQYQQSNSSHELTIITQQSEQSNTITESQSISISSQLKQLQQSHIKSINYDKNTYPLILNQISPYELLSNKQVVTTQQQELVHVDSQQQSCILAYQAKISIYRQIQISKIFNQWKLLVYKPILITHNPNNNTNSKTNNISNNISNKQNVNISIDTQTRHNKNTKSQVKITSHKHHTQIHKQQNQIKRIIKIKYDIFKAWHIQVKYKNARQFWNRKIYRAFFITLSYLLQLRLRSIYVQQILKINKIPYIINKLRQNQKKTIRKVEKIIIRNTLGTLLRKTSNKLAELTYQLKIKKKYWKLLSIGRN